MHTQIVMDTPGDTRHQFDPTDAQALADAEKRFVELTVPASFPPPGQETAVRSGPTLRPRGSGDIVRPEARGWINVLPLPGAPFALIARQTLSAVTDLQTPRGALRKQAEERGLIFLRSWLTLEQEEQRGRENEFEVVGCDTGTRYRLTNCTNLNIIELDSGGAL